MVGLLDLCTQPQTSRWRKINGKFVFANREMPDDASSAVELDDLANSMDEAPVNGQPEAALSTDQSQSRQDNSIHPEPDNTVSRAASISTARSTSVDVQAQRRWTEVSSSGLGNWIGGTAGVGAFLVAIYYGSRSLQLQRWSAFNDFRGSCVQAAQYVNLTSKACNDALSSMPLPPPSRQLTKRFAEMVLACMTFRDECSQENDFTLEGRLQKRSRDESKTDHLMSMLPFGIYLAVLTTIILAVQLSPVFRVSMNQFTTFTTHLGVRFIRWFFHRTAYGRLIRHAIVRVPGLTNQLLLFVSCFSPLYALVFWIQMPAQERATIFKRGTTRRYPTGLWMTLWGGAICAIYVFNWRRAWSLEQEIAEGEWKLDPLSLENQKWRSPARWHECEACDQVDRPTSHAPMDGNIVRRRPYTGGVERYWGPTDEEFEYHLRTVIMDK
jgi:hypothetical protein